MFNIMATVEANPTANASSNTTRPRRNAATAPDTTQSREERSRLYRPSVASLRVVSLNNTIIAGGYYPRKSM